MFIYVLIRVNASINKQATSAEDNPEKFTFAVNNLALVTSELFFESMTTTSCYSYIRENLISTDINQEMWPYPNPCKGCFKDPKPFAETYHVRIDINRLSKPKS